MSDEKITLDKKTFQSLASDTRVNILKSLDKRRKTLSELSKEAGMSVSTISGHLNKLNRSGLVVQKDDGHKWKYYELSRKGRGILYPETRKIWVMLSVSIIAMLAFGTDLFFRSSFGAGAVKSAEMLSEAAGAASSDAAAQTVNVIPTLPLVHIAGIAIFAVLTLAALFLLYKKGFILKK